MYIIYSTMSCHYTGNFHDCSKTVTIDNKNTVPMIQLAPSTNRCALRASLHDKNAIIAS